MNTARTLAAALCFCAPVFAATVTVTPDSTFQTIEGFGVAVPQWLYSSNNTSAIANMMVNDLGVSMLRVYPEADFNPSAGVYNASAPRTAAQFAVVQRAVTAGVERVLLSVFSPPAWMKDNGSLVDGGHLLPDKYEDYAQYYRRYVQALNAAVSTNVVYAISPENEPEWPQWYDSCVFTYAEMRDAIKAIGRQLEGNGLEAVKIFSAETLVSANWGPYYGACLQDTACSRMLDVLAVHAYENNGVTASSPSAVAWRRVRDAVKTRGRTAWMTETSGYDATFADALKYANGIYTGLKYGELSAWVFLTFNTPAGANEQEALCVNGSPKPIYYTSKNYYKWIRPGAVQINTVSDDTTVLAIGFTHARNRTMTIVLTNIGSSAATVTLAGASLPPFTAYRTSAGENCVQVNAVSGNTVTLPAQSITTLYATGYTTGTVSRRAISVSAGPHGASCAFDIRGRRLERSGRLDAPGIYVAGRTSSRSAARSVSLR